MIRKLTLPYLAARDLTEAVEESVLQQYRAFCFSRGADARTFRRDDDPFWTER
jgi:hypothetical protein